MMARVCVMVVPIIAGGRNTNDSGSTSANDTNGGNTNSRNGSVKLLLVAQHAVIALREMDKAFVQFCTMFHRQSFPTVAKPVVCFSLLISLLLPPTLSWHSCSLMIGCWKSITTESPCVTSFWNTLRGPRPSVNQCSQDDSQLIGVVDARAQSMGP